MGPTLVLLSERANVWLIRLTMGQMVYLHEDGYPSRYAPGLTQNNSTDDRDYAAVACGNRVRIVRRTSSSRHDVSQLYLKIYCRDKQPGEFNGQMTVAALTLWRAWSPQQRKTAEEMHRQHEGHERIKDYNRRGRRSSGVDVADGRWQRRQYARVMYRVWHKQRSNSHSDTCCRMKADFCIRTNALTENADKIWNGEISGVE